MAYARVAVLIPAFNEEYTLEGVLKSLPKGVTTYVIDDASSDNTSEIAKRNSAFVLQNQINQGYEKSLLIGFSHILSENKYDAIVLLDADGEHNPSYIDQMLQQVAQGADVVLGVRDKFNRISEIHTAKVYSFLFGIRDPLSGMRVYTVKFMQEYLKTHNRINLGILPLKFACEKKYSLDQVEIEVGKRKGEPRFGSTVKANLTIYKNAFFCLVN